MATFWNTFISPNEDSAANQEICLMCYYKKSLVKKKKEKRETLTSLWSEKLHYKFIESTEDGDFMLALNAVRLLRTSSCDCIHINKHSPSDYNKHFSNTIQDHEQFGHTNHHMLCCKADTSRVWPFSALHHTIISHRVMKTKERNDSFWQIMKTNQCRKITLGFCSDHQPCRLTFNDNS